MKTYPSPRNPKIFVLFATLLAFGVLISSCKKTDNNAVIKGEAQVMIVNSASGSTPQDFYLDNAKVNSQAVAYSQNSGYITTQPGDNRKAEFRTSGSATANWTSNVDLDAGEKYTFFFTGSSNASSGSYSGLMLEDDDDAPSSGKARVRFVNLAQGYTTANLLITGGSTWATNTAFGTSSAFMEVTPGTYSLQTNLASNTTAAVNLGNFTLQAGKIYTIYTRGLLGGSASAAVAGTLIVHN